MPDLIDYDAIILAEAEVLLEEVREVTPFRTGRMRRGWRLDERELVLVNEAPYAGIVVDRTPGLRRLLG